MARTKTWFAEDTGTVLYWSDRNLTATETNSGMGWTVGKTAAGNYSLFVQNTENLASTFSGTIAPNNTAPAADGTAVNGPYDTNCISTDQPYNVFIPAGNWTFTFRVRAVSSGGDQDGRITMRVFKAPEVSATAWGTVTELTSAMLTGTTVLNLTTAAAQSSTITWAAPDITLNNEHIIVKFAWEVTGATNTNSRDVLLWYGPNFTMVTPLFRERTYNIN